jgi:hypothetical protein
MSSRRFLKIHDITHSLNQHTVSALVNWLGGPPLTQSNTSLKLALVFVKNDPFTVHTG